ncbi:MAG: hypothetical protein GKR95_10910 [Gammaproteobacteria bacterium]|nr:hypothetical protein [Gammaproteobacteria bacterium]
MNSVNLLPWRDLETKIKDRRLIVVSFLILVVCIGTTVMRFVSLNQIKQSRFERNSFLVSQIEELEENIIELKESLDERKHIPQ